MHNTPHITVPALQSDGVGVHVILPRPMTKADAQSYLEGCRVHERNRTANLPEWRRIFETIHQYLPEETQKELAPEFLSLLNALSRAAVVDPKRLSAQLNDALLWCAVPGSNQ